MGALDPITIATLSAVNVTIVSAVFILTTTIRYADRASRMWTVAFVSVILTAISLAVYAYSPVDASWAVPVSHTAFAVALALLWSGMRLLNGRPSLAWVSVPVSVLVGVSAFVTPSDSVPIAGAIQLFLCSSIFSILFAVEVLVGNTAATTSARVVATLFGAVGVYQFARTSALVLLGSESSTWQVAFGTTTANLILQSLVVVAAVALMALLADRAQLAGRSDDRAAEHEGVLSAESFRGAAEAWFRRSIRERTVLVFLLIEVGGYREISTAFGREAGRSAVRAIGRITADEAPLTSVVGRVAADCYAVITPVPADDDIDQIAARINARVLRTSIDESDRFRAAAYFGMATTRDLDSRYDELYAAALANLAARRRDETPGEISDAA